ncbi:MAG: hypothetical protein JNJ73_08140 [Hyphomonadaceae bacterium]|nr:hypothetical protein [Hyphomonadaceae bacterium]
MIPTLPQLGRLAFVALTVPTMMALALSERDWLFAAFTSFDDLARASLFHIAYALLAPLFIVGLPLIALRNLTIGRAPALLAAATVFGCLLWPQLDARDYADQRYEAVQALWRTNRPSHYINREIRWGEARPDALIEGALLGCLCALAWLGLETLSAKASQQPLRFRDDRLT